MLLESDEGVSGWRLVASHAAKRCEVWLGLSSSGYEPRFVRWQPVSRRVTDGLDDARINIEDRELQAAKDLAARLLDVDVLSVGGSELSQY